MTKMTREPYKIIYSPKVVEKLMAYGFLPEKSAPNPRKPELTCWLFEWTDEFDAALGEVLGGALMNDKVVIMSKWISALEKRMTVAQFNEACARIIKYGLDKEGYEESEDMMINFALDQIFPQMEAVYSKRVGKSEIRKGYICLYY